MNTHRHARGWFSAALAFALFAPAGCAPGADGGAGGFRVSWSPCAPPSRAECGTLRVPVDWSAPGGEQITLAVARHRADDPAHRIGTLFFNPGGPGDPSSEYAAAAETIFSEALRARFDIVGIDPRAAGSSAKVTCGVPFVTPADTLFPETEQQFLALKRHNREVGLSCRRDTGALAGHSDTVSVARDHEAMRIALGEAKVTWLGLSYGTQVASNYAALYPRRTRAMVLDSALEHSLPEVVQVADEVRAAEETFNRFARWCDTAPSCALRGRDVAAEFDRLVARADASPIPVAGALRPVTGEDIRFGTVSRQRLKDPIPFFPPDLSWAGLSGALAKAIDGDAAAFALPPAEVVQPTLATLASVGCMDYVPQVHTYAQMRQRIQMGRQLAPHLQGASEIWQVLRCIDWPIPVANPPRLLDVRGVPVLMVHSVHDPSDPYQWAFSLGAQVHADAVLTRTGDGHTSYHTSPCARAAIDAYLIRPQAPADRVCDE